MQRLPAVDSLRFWCAFWVLMDHSGTILGLQGLPTDLQVDYRSFWLGAAGVFGFFVISGFCIHLPYATSTAVDWPLFCVRRYLRILIPLTLVIPFTWYLGITYDPLSTKGWITWTLVCELVYYSAYPGLRLLWARLGIGPTLALSLVPCYALIAVWGNNTAGWNGNLRSVFYGLPAWIVGALIADLHARGRAPTSFAYRWYSLLFMRATVLGLVFLAGYMYETGHVSFVWIMPALAIVLSPWLWVEFVRPRPLRSTVWAGSWSYSLYLVHILALFLVVGHLTNLLHLSHREAWVIGPPLALLAAFIYGTVVEAPSHRFARIAGRAVQRQWDLRFNRSRQAAALGEA